MTMSSLISFERSCPTESIDYQPGEVRGWRLKRPQHAEGSYPSGHSRRHSLPRLEHLVDDCGTDAHFGQDRTGVLS